MSNPLFGAKVPVEIREPVEKPKQELLQDQTASFPPANALPAASASVPASYAKQDIQEMLGFVKENKFSFIALLLFGAPLTFMNLKTIILGNYESDYANTISLAATVLAILALLTLALCVVMLLVVKTQKRKQFFKIGVLAAIMSCLLMPNAIIGTERTERKEAKQETLAKQRQQQARTQKLNQQIKQLRNMAATNEASLDCGLDKKNILIELDKNTLAKAGAVTSSETKSELDKNRLIVLAGC